MASFFRRKVPEKKKQMNWDKAIKDQVASLHGRKEIKGHYTLTLNTVSKVNRFANICQSTPAEVTIYDSNGNAVPGDSIMGLFAISLLQPVSMDIKGEERYAVRILDRLADEGIEVTEVSREDATA